MPDFKVSDIIDPKAIDEINRLGESFEKTNQKYSGLAKSLAGSIKINPKTWEELEKKQEAIYGTSKKLADVQTQLNRIQNEYIQTLEKINTKLNGLSSIKTLGDSFNKITDNLIKAIESIDKLAVSMSKVSNGSNTLQKNVTNVNTVISQSSKAVQSVSDEYDNIITSVRSFSGEVEQLAKAYENNNSYIRTYKDNLKEVEKAFKDNNISYDEYLEKSSKLNTEIRNLSAENQQYNAILKNHAMVMSSTEGSYIEMNAAVLQLEKQLKSLSAQDRQGKIGHELLEQITQLKTELKNIDAEIGNYQRNVGNYSSATDKLTTTIRNNTEELARMRLAGEKGSIAYNKLANETSALKDALMDANAEVKNMADDTSTLNSVLGLAAVGSGGFSAFTGAMELFGAKSEEVQEAQKKLQAGIAITTGLQAIQNNLQSQSALMLGVSKIQTLALAKAEAYRRLIQIKGTSATVGATIAQKAFNLVAKANPYVLIASALLTVIGGLALFVSGSDKATKQLKKLNEANEAYLRGLERKNTLLRESSQRTIEGLESEKNILEAQGSKLSDIWKIEDKIMIERKRAHNQYYKDNKTEIDQLEQNKKQYEDSIVLLNQVEKLKAAGNNKIPLEIDGQWKKFKAEDAVEYVQNQVDRYSKKVQIGLSFYTDDENIKETSVKQAEQRKDQWKTIQRNEQQLIRKSEEENTKLITNEYEKRRKEINGRYAYQINDLKNYLKDEKNLTANGIKAVNDTIVSYRKQREKELEDLRKEEIARNQKDNLQTNIDISRSGSKEEMQARLDLLEFETQQEIEIAIQKGESINNIVLRAQKRQTEIIEEYASVRVAKMEEEMSMESILLNSNYLKEEKKLADQYAKGLINQEQYEEAKIKLSQKYALEAAQNTINNIQKILDAEKDNLDPNERVRLERELVKAQINLSDLVTQHKIENSKRSVETQKRELQQIEEMVQHLSSLMNELSSFGSAIYDRQIQKIEEQQEANNTAGQEEIDRIERQAELGAISTEVAEARKRAAEDKTAAREKELAKQKAEIQTKQARMDKANAVMQTIINTALAIMKVWGQTGIGGFSLAPIVAALGAVQLGTILAQPIPKYAKGTGNKLHPGGLAVVGDGGRPETIVTPTGMFISPATATLVDLPKDTAVYPDVSSFEQLKRIKSDLSLHMSYADKTNQPIIINNDYSRLEKKLDTLSKLSIQQMRQNEKHFRQQQYQMFKNNFGKL